MQVKRIVTLEDAIIFAADLHRGQRDKAGEPYILHPLRVALRVRTDRERLAAVLHDVVGRAAGRGAAAPPREVRTRARAAARSEGAVGALARRHPPPARHPTG